MLLWKLNNSEIDHVDVDASLPTLALHQPQGLKSTKESKWVEKLKDCVMRAQVMAMEHTIATIEEGNDSWGSNHHGTFHNAWRLTTNFKNTRLFQQWI
jgi:hypothetical protein